MNELLVIDRPLLVIGRKDAFSLRFHSHEKVSLFEKVKGGRVGPPRSTQLASVTLVESKGSEVGGGLLQGRLSTCILTSGHSLRLLIATFDVFRGLSGCVRQVR
jgi:hypothetical protein